MVLDSPQWWLALRRDERRPEHCPDGELARRRGRRRWDSWLADRAVTGGLEPDLSRWAEGGEDRLVSLLGETAESLRERLPAHPDWLAALARAWSSPDPWDETPDEDPGHGLLALVRPLMVRYRDELRTELYRLEKAHGDGLEIGADHPLLRPPLENLLGMITAVLAGELHRIRGDLSGDTGADRFDDFARRLRDPAESLRLLRDHPVLARQVVEALAAWVTVRAELARHLLTDLPALSAEFGTTVRSLADVVEVDYGAGDSHRGGRSVAILTVAGGARLVYKPRGLAVEVHFFALLDWLNRKGLAHPLRRLRVLDRPGHGWVEFVPAAGCPDEPALQRFYWRQGAYLALLHVLRICDIHMENLIAAGEHPVVVDLEAAFQQPFADGPPRVTALPEPAARLVAESVLAVGLLPQRMVSRDGEGVRSLDMSGLAGAGGQLTPMAVPRWQDGGTDRMRRERAPVPMPAALNMPSTVDGVDADPLRYRDDFVDGFESCYRLLLAHRDELVAPGGPVEAFAGDETRFLVQPTMVYARILSESWHPLVLRDALDRDCLFEVLAGRHPELTDNDRIVASECRQLAGRDIPYFATTPGSRDLHDDAGLLVPDFFDRTGLDLVRERIARLSPTDLRRQRWTVNASLAALRIGEDVRDGAPRRRELPDEGLDERLALRAATAIGDRLLDSVFGDPPVWLTLTLVADRYWTVAPTGFDSYGGLCGIAIFLAELDARIPAADPGTTTPYRAAAEAIAAMLVHHLDALATWPAEAHAALSVGGFMDLGGYLYTLAHLGGRWDSADLLARAHGLVPDLVRRLPSDRHLDVVFGTAGAALALRALHVLDPTEDTATGLRVAGDHLLSQAVPQEHGLGWVSDTAARAPLLGFSHGASGIGYSLAEIGHGTGDDRYLAGAAGAVAYEHSQYDARRGTWPDHRAITTEGVSMNAWCHGPAGIGLARSAMSDVDDRVAVDLAAAVAAVRRDLVADGELTGIGNDSLCHGDLGLAETLLAAGLSTGDGELVDLARRCGHAVATAVLAGEEMCGVPHGLHVPGLLMGTAGIGYGLLRLAAPDQVPNILLLEPLFAPVSRRRSTG